MKIVNPIEYAEWDNLLLSSGINSFFHTSGWAKTLHESYGYTPLYFTSIEDGKLTTLIPMMEVKSILTGKRGVSLPFSDHCEAMAPDGDTFKEALDEIISYGKKAQWKHIDLRGGEKHLPNATPSLSHYAHTLDLEKGEDEIFQNFHSSNRRNIKKAMREGIEVKISYTFDALKSFFNLNCITRKRHGLPPQPLKFFKKIYDHIISKKKGFIALALYKKKVIAANVYFHFGNHALYKYGASDMNYSQLRPNNLVMWEAIKWFIQNRFSTLDFGITEMSNEGLLRFKRGWGVEERTINYYKYDLRRDKFVKDDFRAKTSYTLFKKMPQSLLNFTGSLIYKHFG